MSDRPAHQLVRCAQHEPATHSLATLVCKLPLEVAPRHLRRYDGQLLRPDRLALVRHPAGGSSPTSPSTASRSRSACPVCRPYYSIRSQTSRRKLAWRPSGQETWMSWSSPPSAKAASSLARDRSTAPSQSA